MRITEIIITPIAVPDLSLSNTKGVHKSVFLRGVIEVKTSAGLTDLGEAYGATCALAGLQTTDCELIRWARGNRGTIKAVNKNVVQIILSDHHNWRSATGAIQLDEMCRDGRSNENQSCKL